MRITVGLPRPAPAWHRLLLAVALTGVLVLPVAAERAAPSRLALQYRETGTGEKGPPTTAPQANKVPAPLLTREEILADDPARLERIGRHIIIGYHVVSNVRALVAKRAIAGVFITDHNVRRRSATQVKAEIDGLQKIRSEQGLPPLIVAADQEGGTVSRLSPPLRRQPSLARALAKVEHDVDRKVIVEDYARKQGAELARIGVNLNFAPVVDLKLKLKDRRDGETRLLERAISDDPYTVAKVAAWYCDGLAEFNIMCTLKHFPGLGRVTRDTHRSMAEVSASEGTLELNDWVPFRRVMPRSNAVMMLGHVRVGAIDKNSPASYSEAVIKTLVRENWSYDGLIITDDFSMGAITRSKMGLGQAPVKSLNAGTDFILVSWSEKDLNAVMSALLAADAAGEIDDAVTELSRARIDRLLRPRVAEAP